jgi:acyl-CoA synthetase (AMP-forming)/AMP-acid ligase II
VLLAGFDAGAALDLIEDHGVTSTVGAPTMWWRLLEESAAHDHKGLWGLRLALYGGAPMPAAQLSRMRVAMPQAVFGNGYGMTETCSMVTFIGGAEAMAHPASVGRPLPITALRIVDAVTGEDTPPGETGEVLVRGGQVAQGYWSLNGITPLADDDGWVHTGDAAALDDGFVVLRG